jgi:hypothetical protein
VPNTQHHFVKVTYCKQTGSGGIGMIVPMKGDIYASELGEVVAIDYNEHDFTCPPLFMPRFLVK